jgi:imidazolonepropionase-like amidohydrolase
MKNRITAFVFLFAAAAFAADAPPKVVALRAARLIDGRGGAVVSPAVIVVRGNKIESIGGTVPADAQVIDLGDMTLLPGLIDAHVHTLLQGDITAEDYDTQLFKESLAYRALRASKAVKIALNNGFTTVRDLETEGAMYTDVDVKRAINNGVIDGPRMVVSTRAMSVTGGYGPSGYSPEVTYPMGVQIVDGVDQARKAVREQIAHGADWIKVYADRSYFVAKDGTLSSTPTFNAEEMKAIVEEAHRLRHKVAAHAMARPGIENALNAGVDSIEHGISIPDDLLDVMIAKGTYLCPTLSVTDYVAAGRGGIWLKIPAFPSRQFFARAETRREDRVRHRRRRLRLGRVQRGERVFVRDEIRDDADAGHSDRHAQCRRSPRHVRPRRHDRSRQAGRHRGGAGQSAERHHGDGAGRLRDEGRERLQTAVAR